MCWNSSTLLVLSHIVADYDRAYVTRIMDLCSHIHRFFGGLR